MTAVRTPSQRGPNLVMANPQKLESADGRRWALGRNVKSSVGPGMYRAIEVWTLKERREGKVVTVAAHRDRISAERWILPLDSTTGE